MNNTPSLDTFYAMILKETPEPEGSSVPWDLPNRTRVERCRAYLEKMPDAVSGQGGHDATFAAACRIVEFVGDDPAAWDLLQWWNINKCTPLWSDRELQHKLDDALRVTRVKPEYCEEQFLTSAKRKGTATHTPTTKNDTNSRACKFSPNLAAKRFLEAYTINGDVLLKRWDKYWYRYENGYYQTIDEETLQAEIWKSLEHHGWGGSRNKVNEVESALRSLPGVLIPIDANPPFWLDQPEKKTDETLLVQNGILDIRSGSIEPATPKYFSQGQSRVVFDPDANCSRWERFLDQIFAGDSEQIALLQQWFGLCLTQRTDYQKILLLLGPVRSGKGTIQCILEHLVGISRIASLTSSQISSRFGFATFADKQIATFTDLRIGSRVDQAAVTEHLLTATGEDLLPIERKFREVKTARCKARITILSNELPSFVDTAGALAARMLFLQTKTSFEGQEDYQLRKNLLNELSGILNWSISGYQRLIQYGFVQPQSTAYLRSDLRDLCSPIRAWVDQRAKVQDGGQWMCTEAFDDWRRFAIDNNYAIGNERAFGRKLREAYPLIERVQRRINGQRVWIYLGIRERAHFED